MVRYDNYGYARGRKGSTVLWLLLGIVAFATLYYPFFGGNLKFKVVSFVEPILTFFGTFFLIIGGILVVVGFILLFTQSIGKGIKLSLYGFLLIILGLAFVEPGSFGFISHVGRPAPKGYH
ncbi:hypothetical protein ES703_51396 [subsurface metagenome]